jgi:hypothetical protein
MGPRAVLDAVVERKIQQLIFFCGEASCISRVILNVTHVVITHLTRKFYWNIVVT